MSKVTTRSNTVTQLDITCTRAGAVSELCSVPVVNKYSKWIVSQFNRGNLPVWNLKEIQNTLVRFDRIKSTFGPLSHHVNGVSEDIMQFQSYSDLYNAVNGKYDLKYPVDVIYAQGQYLVIRVSPMNHGWDESVNAIQKLGTGTSWCTREDYPQGSLARRYLDETNEIFVILKNGKPHVQMAMWNDAAGEWSGKFMINDDYDRPLGVWNKRVNLSDMIHIFRTVPEMQRMIYGVVQCQLNDPRDAEGNSIPVHIDVKLLKFIQFIWKDLNADQRQWVEMELRYYISREWDPKSLLPMAEEIFATPVDQPGTDRGEEEYRIKQRSCHTTEFVRKPHNTKPKKKDLRGTFRLDTKLAGVGLWSGLEAEVFRINSDLKAGKVPAPLSQDVIDHALARPETEWDWNVKWQKQHLDNITEGLAVATDLLKMELNSAKPCPKKISRLWNEEAKLRKELRRTEINTELSRVRVEKKRIAVQQAIQYINEFVASVHV